MNFSELFKKFDLESVMLYIAAIVFFPIVIGFMLIKIVGGADAADVSRGSHSARNFCRARKKSQSH